MSFQDSNKKDYLDQQGIKNFRNKLDEMLSEYLIKNPELDIFKKTLENYNKNLKEFLSNNAFKLSVDNFNEFSKAAALNEFIEGKYPWPEKVKALEEKLEQARDCGAYFKELKNLIGREVVTVVPKPDGTVNLLNNTTSLDMVKFKNAYKDINEECCKAVDDNFPNNPEKAEISITIAQIALKHIVTSWFAEDVKENFKNMTASTPGWNRNKGSAN